MATNTEPASDAAQQAVNPWQETNYNVFDHNCVLMVNNALDAAGVQHGTSWVPCINFNQSLQLGSGTQINLE